MEKTTTATWIILSTFNTHLKTKSITAIFVALFERIIEWNEILILLIFSLYFIDLLLWIIRALKRREFCLTKFFWWASKILIYWIFILIWVSLDEALHLWNLFIWSIFAFIIITDTLSILVSLDKLWYDTPIFIRNYLLQYKKTLDEKFKNSKWD